MSRDAVVDLLGQRDGFEEEYERARASGSTYYLFWNQEIDLTYAIGFDVSPAVEAVRRPDGIPNSRQVVRAGRSTAESAGCTSCSPAER